MVTTLVDLCLYERRHLYALAAAIFGLRFISQEHSSQFSRLLCAALRKFAFIFFFLIVLVWRAVKGLDVSVIIISDGFRTCLAYSAVVYYLED